MLTESIKFDPPLGQDPDDVTITVTSSYARCIGVHLAATTGESTRRHELQDVGCEPESGLLATQNGYDETIHWLTPPGTSGEVSWLPAIKAGQTRSYVGTVTDGEMEAATKETTVTGGLADLRLCILGYAEVKQLTATGSIKFIETR